MERLKAENNLHRRAAVALGGGVAMVAVPLLLLSGPAQADHSAAAIGPAAADPGQADPGQADGWAQRLAVWERLDGPEVTASPTPAPPSSPPAPATAPVTVTAAAQTPVTTVAAAQTPVTTVAAPVTTVVAAPATTVPVPPPTTSGPQGSQSGQATWYRSPWSTGCASPTLPFGTRLEVTDAETGTSAPCVVDDREPNHPGRVVDLSYHVFTELASPTQGVITVTITW